MIRIRPMLAFVMLLFAFCIAQEVHAQTSTPTVTPTATVTPTPTLTPPPVFGTGYTKSFNGPHIFRALLDLAAGLRIGPSGTPITSSYRITTTVDIASIAANTCTDTTVTLSGAALGAECSVGSPSALTAGLLQGCRVSASNTVLLRTCNVTVGAVDPASLTYSVRVFNP